MSGCRSYCTAEDGCKSQVKLLCQTYLLDRLFPQSCQKDLLVFCPFCIPGAQPGIKSLENCFHLISHSQEQHLETYWKCCLLTTSRNLPNGNSGQGTSVSVRTRDLQKEHFLFLLLHLFQDLVAVLMGQVTVMYRIRPLWHSVVREGDVASFTPAVRAQRSRTDGVKGTCN